MSAPSAVITGLQGTALTAWEKDFLKDADPFGIILFTRNCETPAQVSGLINDVRDVLGRSDAPVLIDQEGGRVARLKPPAWPEFPAPAAFGEIALKDEETAVEAAWLNARLLAEELSRLGITVNCTPVIDVPQNDADPIIGDRAAGPTPELAVLLGGAVCEAHLGAGVFPVIKHIPGHGRALVDSHEALPRVAATKEDLRLVDFAPFAALSHMPWAMTAHVVYEAFDADHPATHSKTVINDVIRGEIGFKGLLVSDDLSMKALGGSFEERTDLALKAGCDVVLHCNGDKAEMQAVMKGAGPLSSRARDLFGRAKDLLAPEAFDVDMARTRLKEIVT